jgi:hypothetical protein
MATHEHVQYFLLKECAAQTSAEAFHIEHYSAGWDIVEGNIFQEFITLL